MSGHALDLPRAGDRVGRTASIAGWLVAQEPWQLVWVAAGGADLQARIHAIDRPDVVERLGPGTPLACGFAGSVNLEDLPDGAATLDVGFAFPSLSDVVLSVAVTVDASVVPPARLVVDKPAAGARLAGRALVAGWLDVGPGVVSHVDVVCGVERARLTSGIARPDLAGVLVEPLERVGFAGELDLGFTAPGPALVTVTAVMLRGDDVRREIPIELVARAETTAGVDGIAIRGDLIEIDGWALGRDGGGEAVLKVDERVLARSGAELTTPALAARRPWDSEAVAAGWKLVATVAECRDHGAGASVTWRSDSGDDEALIDIPLVAAELDRAYAAASLAALLGELPADCREALVWTESGLAGLASGGALRPFAPPVASPARLPHRDGSVDVVVVDDPSRVDEARRVARRFVVRSDRGLIEAQAGAHSTGVSTVRPRGSANERSVLFVTPEPPRLDRDSGSFQLHRMAEVLRADGWAVTILAREVGVADCAVDELEALGIRVVAGPQSAGRRLPDVVRYPGGFLQREQFDLAIVAYWSLAAWMIPELRSWSPGTRVLVTPRDLHFVREVRQVFAARSRPGEAPALGLGRGAAFVEELNAYAAADGLIAISDPEERMLRELLGAKASIWHVPLTVGRQAVIPPFSQRRGQLFVANYSFAPNVAALESLIADVLPRLPDELRREHPLRVVGSGLTRALAERLDGIPGIEVVGWVPRLADELSAARVFVAPLSFGAGVKGKVVSALAAGLPVVTTSVGAEGIGAGVQGMRVHDREPDFALAVQTLLCDADAWQAASAAGQDVAIAHGPERMAEALRAAVAGVTAGPERQPPARA